MCCERGRTQHARTCNLVGHPSAVVDAYTDNRLSQPAILTFSHRQRRTVFSLASLRRAHQRGLSFCIGSALHLQRTGVSIWASPSRPTVPGWIPSFFASRSASLLEREWCLCSRLVRPLLMSRNPLPSSRCSCASLASPQGCALPDRSIVALVANRDIRSSELLRQVTAHKADLGQCRMSIASSLCDAVVDAAVASSDDSRPADAYIPTSLYALSGLLCDNVQVPGAQLGIPES